MCGWTIRALRFILVSLCTSSAVIIASTPALAGTLEWSQPVIATVTIPSTRPWTDTGIVVAEGDRIEIVASGLVSWDSSHNKTGPDGTDNPAGTDKNVVVDPTVPAQSLVGNVAETVTLDGRGFFVGSHFSGEIPIANTTSASGRLFLGFNDGAVFSDRSGYDAWGFGGDNQGSFTAVITVVREPPVPQSVAPKAHIDLISPNPVRVEDRVSFLGSGTDPNDRTLVFEWFSDRDGLLSTEALFTKDDLSEGKHEILFRVTNEDGVSSEVRYSLDVGPSFLEKPLARITNISPSTPFPGEDISFTGEGIDPNDRGISEYQWKAGDELLSTKRSFMHAGLRRGEYAISLKVRNADGLWSDPDYRKIKVISRPPSEWAFFWMGVISITLAVVTFVAGLLLGKRRQRTD